MEHNNLFINYNERYFTALNSLSEVESNEEKKGRIRELMRNHVNQENKSNLRFKALIAK